MQPIKGSAQAQGSIVVQLEVGKGQLIAIAIHASELFIVENGRLYVDNFL